MLTGKRIILGITGSIAAYKAAFLTRLLVKAGAEVKVIMTPAAHDFITPLTLSTLSKQPVLTAFVADETGQWNNHVDLGLWADLMVVAPATADSLAKLASGVCDTLLAAVYLSARCPIVFVPAMDHDMFIHPATQENLDRLTRYGNHILNPEYGELASGLSGQGRMAEPETIFNFISGILAPAQRFKGKRVLITAGPTYEALDPVRFIGNHSSGKMGFALAERLAEEGAQVTLVTGPTQLHASHPGITPVPVVTASEMFNVCKDRFDEMDITILSAAVADFKPSTVSPRKIKKGEKLTLELVRTEDIAEQLGKKKRANQVLVGFALETDNEQSNATEKLRAKNFDLIVLNSLNDPGAGFGHDTNKVTLITAQGQVSQFELKSKKEVAGDILDAISALSPVHA